MKYVALSLKDETIEGLLVKEDDKHVVIKLKSGYNIGISRRRIIDMKEFEQKIVSKEDGLPKVLILHTGGTIASKVDYQTGAVTPRFSPEELTSMFPEIRDLAHIESRLLRNMASDDMRFAHYNLMAKEIKKELESDKNLKGIIITQGTDTIHYTSAALSFIFENLPIPVVITGAQRSSDRGSTDAAMNLISAVAFIANTSLKGVFICFHENISDDNCIILNGLNAKKFHSSRRDAFKPINIPPIARINYLTKDIDYISEYPQSALNSEGTLKLHLFDEDLKIAIIVSHPNMSASEFEPYKDFDGIILEGTGLCHFPINEIDEYTKEHTNIKNILESLAKKIPIVMTLQTVYGTVNMNVYSPGRALLEMGIIGNYSSLCTETSFVKLAWLLSQKLDPKEYFMKDLRGEFSNKEMGE
jgi:glutamyl-tRNA(Gln) amidotransferase subunit D